MSKFIGAACVVLAVLVPAAAAAQAKVDTPVSVTCQVSGYDVVIRNIGDSPLADGTTIEWSVPFARQRGSHALASELLPGGDSFLTGVLGSNYLDPSTACVITRVTGA